MIKLTFAASSLIIRLVNTCSEGEPELSLMIKYTLFVTVIKQRISLMFKAVNTAMTEVLCMYRFSKLKP